MKLFNRDPAMYVRNISRIPPYAWYFLKCFLLFREPLRFIQAYLRRQPPPDGRITLRSGMEIRLSGHPHDVVTVFVIFVRRDYGGLPPGCTVIDIGANIGVFSLFAAHCGARSVRAYEPNSEAFRCLQSNIRANRLEAAVAARQFAVTGKAGGTVRFPKQASAYNAILPEQSTVDSETVATTDLAEILAGMDRVDVLKLDCEGAERDILTAAERSVLDKIDSIRMEYHLGHRDEITGFLETNGFSREYATGTMEAGTMWFSRRK
jgi:FkbM family methyltransferase